MTYARGSNTASLNVNGIGQLLSFRDKFYQDNLAYEIRLDADRPRMLSYPYIGLNKGYATAEFNGSHRFSSKIDGVVQMLNLTNWYGNDASAQYAAIGRQTKVGVRMRF
jgi:hypothetical protein